MLHFRVQLLQLSVTDVTVVTVQCDSWYSCQCQLVKVSVVLRAAMQIPHTKSISHELVFSPTSAIVSESEHSERTFYPSVIPNSSPIVLVPGLRTTRNPVQLPMTID